MDREGNFTGQTQAPTIWLGSFWRALDRMYGGGNLLDPSS